MQNEKGSDVAYGAPIFNSSQKSQMKARLSQEKYEALRDYNEVKKAVRIVRKFVKNKYINFFGSLKYYKMTSKQFFASI